MNFSNKQPSKSSKNTDMAAPTPTSPTNTDTSATNLANEPSSSAIQPDSDGTGKDVPIPPAGELMQYRAIGLVKGRYIPSLEQFTQGSLVSQDNTLIDAVLLGRVMSLVKKHIDLAEDHLWVVYPRVGKEDSKLHLQIVGIWEPQTLKTDEQKVETPENSADSLRDGYFSIRGEVIYQSKEEPHIIVKIKQAPRKRDEKPKFFKLKIQGSLADKMVGHFWELNVQRQGEILVIESGSDICELPKSKPVRKKFPPRRGSRPESSRPIIGQKSVIPKPTKDNSANSDSHPPNLFRKPIPKPSKRKVEE